MAEDPEALAYYRNQVDRLAGENVAADFRISSLSRELRQVKFGFEALIDLHEAIASARSDVDVLARATERFALRLTMDRAVALRRPARSGEPFVPVSSLGLEPGMNISLPASLGDRYAKSRKVQLISQDEAGDAPAELVRVRQQLGLSVLVVIPLFVSHECAAFLLAGRIARHSELAEIPVEDANVMTFESFGAVLSATLDTRRLEREKDELERHITGGFAHEMRNALSASRLLLARAMGDGETDGSMTEMNGLAIRNLFTLVRDRVPGDVRGEMAAAFQEMIARERALHVILAESDYAVRRALRITDEILAYSRAGTHIVGSERVALAAIIRSVINAIQDTLAPASIEVDLDLDETATTKSDPGHVHSIVSNLILNARDALGGSPGRRVLSVSVTRVGASCELRVEDTGAGIAQKHLSHIFNPFFTTKPDTGTGLGLGVTRKLVLLYGGTIRVESEPGRGALFIVTLPQAGESIMPPR